MKRNTAQRLAIEKVFIGHENPLSVDGVLQYARADATTLNQATVYRNLKMLVDEGWLTKIAHPLLGTLYERAGKQHHHHFHCHACQRVYELPGCSLKKDEIAPQGFSVEDHEIFLFGLCAACNSHLAPNC